MSWPSCAMPSIRPGELLVLAPAVDKVEIHRSGQTINLF